MDNNDRLMKYIDADRLRAEIDKIEEEARTIRVSGTDKEAIGADSKVKLCLKLKSIINSLQQEQPEVNFEDIEFLLNKVKYMRGYWVKTNPDCTEIVKDFNKRLNARKEE